MQYHHNNFITYYHTTMAYLHLIFFLSVICSIQSLRTPTSFHNVDLIPQGDNSLRPIHVELIHRDTFIKQNLTYTERWRRRIQRSHLRLAKLSASSVETTSYSMATLESDVAAGDGEYLMKLAIGTPALSYSAILDTGSDLTWTQCQPCKDCYAQPTPIYDPKQSSTYGKVPCDGALCKALPSHQCKASSCMYTYAYGDYSYTAGELATETFTFGDQKVPMIGFGCGEDNEGGGFSQGAGLVGLGRGPLSLTSQIGVSKFSYCLSSSKTSKLILGGDAVADSAPGTPLIQNSQHSTFYYINLLGISVGTKAADIPTGLFDISEDGSGGMIIDSGTTITYLEETAYQAVKTELKSAVGLPVSDGSSIGLDTCFQGSDMSRFPELTLHFQGADMVLKSENYIVSDGNGDLCLAMLPSSGMSVLGNVQQENFRMVYDSGNNVLSFSPTSC